MGGAILLVLGSAPGDLVSASSESCFLAGGAVWLVVLPSPPPRPVDLDLDVNTHEL